MAGESSANTDRVPTINQGVLWDKVDYTSGGSNLALFGHSQSSSGFEVTNLTIANRINTEKFVVEGVELSAEFGGAGIPEDIADIWEWTYVEVKQPSQGTPVLRLPSRLLGSTVTIYGLDNRSAGAGQVAVQPWSGGSAYGLLRSVTLFQNDTFGGAIRSDVNSASITITSNVHVALALHGTEGGHRTLQ